MSAGAAFAGIQIAGAVLGGLQANSAARAEARGLDESGRLELLAGEQEAATTLREERQVSGEAIAAMAGGSTMVGTGTALDIIRQNAIEREVEIGNIRAQARARDRDYRQAAIDRRHQGRQALIGSLFDAAGKAASYAIDRGTQGKVDAQAARERESRLPTSSNRIMPGEHSQTDAIMWGEAGPFRRRRFGVLSMPGRG